MSIAKPSRWATLTVALLALTVVGPVVQAGPQSCDTRVNNTVKKLLECLTVEGVREHQAAFQAAADANGGIRASGTPGYDASAEYVADRMEAAGYDVTVQEFDFDFFEEISTPIFQQIAPIFTDYPANDIAGFVTMEFSGSGDVTAPVTAVDLQLPPGPVANSSTSGCEVADFLGFPAGNIALIQRGTCTFFLKALNAQNHGAAGVIIFNEGQVGRTNAFAGTLGGVGINIPTIGTSFAIGEDLATAVGPVARIKVDAFSETRTTANVLAESKKGDSSNVVMAGAHLDSVTAGPGIQDNGSGSAAILEIAEQMAKVKPRNQVRFAWWGAEEQGLVGSINYIVGLSAEEHANIALYLNFDMIGSPNFARFVYDGDGSDIPPTIFVPPESAVIEQLFLDYYNSQGLPSEATVIGQRSDHFAFCVTGIPCGGLFTGAEGLKTAAQVLLYGGTEGDQYDPCYHLACDTFDNISLTALDQNSDAAAFAILTFAMNTESVNGQPGKGNFKPQNQLKSLEQLPNG